MYHDIYEFLNDVLTLYGMKFSEFLESKNKRCLEEQTIFKRGVVTKDVLMKLCEATGLTERDIQNYNEEAALKYYLKFKFFNIFNRYKKEYRKSQRNDMVLSGDEYEVLNRAFSNELPIQFKYDLDNVKRAIRKEARKANVNHKGAKIVDLYIDTDEICSFADVKELFESYFELIERLTELYNIMLINDLNEEEIAEWNFLVYALDVRIVLASPKKATYRNIKKVMPEIKIKGEKNFFYICQPRRFVDTCPWRIVEVREHKCVLDKLATQNQYLKDKIEGYIKSVENYMCDFYWSDAEMLYENCDLSNTGIPKKEAKLRVRTLICVPKDSFLSMETISHLEWLRSIISDDNGLPYYENYPGVDSVEGIRLSYERLASLV